MRPRIAIPIPTSTDLEYNQRSWPQYAAAVEQAGGEAVKLELAASDVMTVAESCQGILLPGSPADWNPLKYGQEPDPATAPADPAREAVDTLLLEEAHRLRKPILGICFGVQSLNVWRGGTLVQDVTVLPVNHAAGPAIAIAHAAAVAPDSLLGQLLDPAEAPVQDGFLRLPINSSHHQALGAPGDGLRVVARCPQDGVIEAVEGSDEGHFVLGVQWHPERSCAISAASRALFAHLIAEAAAWATR